MLIEWTLPSSPAPFQEWLKSHADDEAVGLPAGFRKHPIVTWFAREGHEIILSTQRSSLYIQDKRTGNLLLVPSGHWIARFCRALMPPDSLRDVTVLECKQTLARVLEQQ